MENTTKLSAEQIAKLDEAQRDGRACVHCAGDEGALKPIGWLDGCQVFEHAGCGEEAEEAEEAGPDDLDEAVSRGFLLLPAETPHGAELRGKVLRFDPSLPASRRAPIVRALLASAEHVAPASTAAPAEASPPPALPWARTSDLVRDALALELLGVDALASDARRLLDCVRGRYGRGEAFADADALITAAEVLDAHPYGFAGFGDPDAGRRAAAGLVIEAVSAVEWGCMVAEGPNIPGGLEEYSEIAERVFAPSFEGLEPALAACEAARELLARNAQKIASLARGAEAERASVARSA